jgi:antirestriction protein
MNLYDDVIDVRDIIARIEEIEDAQRLHNEEHGEGDWLGAYPSDAEEIALLSTIMEEMKGYGGDEQWRGDWYPLILIRESHFTDYVQEMLEDCGQIPKDLPHYIHIDWEATARDVQVDFTPIDVDGATYFYR